MIRRIRAAVSRRYRLILVLAFALMFLFPESRLFAGEPKDGFAVNFYRCEFLPRTEAGYGEEIRVDLSRFRDPAAGAGTVELICHRNGYFDYRLEKHEAVFMPRRRAEKYSPPVDFTINLNDGRRVKRVCFTLVPAEKYCDASVAVEICRYPELAGATDGVFIAGEMNSWDAKSVRLTAEKGSGIYAAAFPKIKRGKYRYKFVAGGKWMPDPSNSIKEPDGFGSFNSIMTAGRVPEKSVVVPEHSGFESGRFRFTLKYLGSSPAPELSFSIGGVALPGKYIRFEKVSGRFEIDAPAEALGEDVGANPAVRYYSFATGPEGEVFEISDEYLFYRALPGGGPAAFRDSVMYFAMTDRFKNSDPSNDRPLRTKGLAPSCDYMGGDYAGIMEAARSGYFSDLGADMLWISPVVAGPPRAYRDYLPPKRLFSGYHGYWPEDPGAAEPRFGSWRELSRMVDFMRRKYKIEVIMDAVFRHVTRDSAVFRDHPEFFLPAGLPDGSMNIRLFDKYPETTWFDSFLPAFDYGRPDARKFMAGAAERWIRMSGVRGFRLDAVKHVPKVFWSELLREKAGFFTVGETIDSREKIASYICPGMLTAQFDFPLYFAIIDTFARGKKDFQAFDAELARSESEFWYSHRLTSNLLGNHDFPRFMAYADGWLDDVPGEKEKELGFSRPPFVRDAGNYRKLRMAWAFLMSTNGIPLIYYGDEYGESGAGDPDNRRMMRFGNELGAFERDNVAALRKLSALRKKHPALFEGVRVALEAGRKSYVFAKIHFDETFVIAFNYSDGPSVVKFTIGEKLSPGGYLEDAFSGERFRTEPGGLVKLPMRTYGYRYLRLARTDQ